MQRRRLMGALSALIALPRARAQAGPEAVPPAGRQYVAMALVSDKLSFVEKVGGVSDPTQNRPRTAEVPLPGSPYDLTALRAIAAALPEADPGARMSFLAGSSPEFYADQERWFDGDAVTLPAGLQQAIAGEHAGRLLLLTKWRGDAAIPVGNATVGSGKISGLGFYRFARREGQSRDDTEVHNYIAPFVYARLSLIDIAASKVLRSANVQTARPYPGDLAPQAQIDALVELLEAGTRDAVRQAFRNG